MPQRSSTSSTIHRRRAGPTDSDQPLQVQQPQADDRHYKRHKSWAANSAAADSGGGGGDDGIDVFPSVGDLYQSIITEPSSALERSERVQRWWRIVPSTSTTASIPVPPPSDSARNQPAVFLKEWLWSVLVRHAITSSSDSQHLTTITSHDRLERIHSSQLLAVAIVDGEQRGGSGSGSGRHSNALDFLDDNTSSTVDEEEDEASKTQRTAALLAWKQWCHTVLVEWKPDSWEFKTIQAQVAHLAWTDMVQANHNNRCEWRWCEDGLAPHMAGADGSFFWPYLPARRREWELRKSQQQHQHRLVQQPPQQCIPSESSQPPPYLIIMIHDLLRLVEGGTLKVLLKAPQRQQLLQEDDGDDINSPMDSEEDDTEQAWSLVHVALAFLNDLLSLPTAARAALVLYLDAHHVALRCRRALGYSTYSRAMPNMLLAQQLLDHFDRWLHFPVVSMDAVAFNQNQQGQSVLRFPVCQPLDSVQIRTLYHKRASILQKMCHRYYAQQLPDVIYAGVGMLCTTTAAGTANWGPKNINTFLRTALGGFSDQDLLVLMHKMRLIDHPPRNASSCSSTFLDYEAAYLYDRDFLLEVLEGFLCMPTDPLLDLQSTPLYPTEQELWDFARVPPSHACYFLSGHENNTSKLVLALPKLQNQFLSFVDYLWRNFTLTRLETAYEIRSDLVDAVRRLRPMARQVAPAGDDPYNGTPDPRQGMASAWKTEFTGWARMALELSGPVEVVQVHKPLLGETYPAQVLAEFTIDLKPCGAKIRQEWDDLGDFDNIFLVTIDAHDASLYSTAAVTDHSRRRPVPDEDDPSFPRRFGIRMVRGCMIVQVRDESGNVLTQQPKDTTGSHAAVPSGTKRIFRVALDPAQYVADARTTGEVTGSSSTDLYRTLNLVVRRHGRENNFKSVLETIRGLMAGMGSIHQGLPSWLQPVLLGQGDPNQAHYQSTALKDYARTTAGVADPESFLDYSDTFVDELHLRASFAGIAHVLVDSQARNSTHDADPTPTANPASAVDSDTSDRKNYCVRVFATGDASTSMEARSYPFTRGIQGNPIRFTPVQVEAIRSGLSPGLTIVIGPPGTGKTDVAVQIIAALFRSFTTQRTVVITHSNAALNDIFQKVMTRGDIPERYLLRLGAGERDLETASSHDFTKAGRVAYSFAQRAALLEEVQKLSESLGISGRAERSADGSPSYTCETAGLFYEFEVKKRWKDFCSQLHGTHHDANVLHFFPFTAFFKTQEPTLSLVQSKALYSRLVQIFDELAEYQPLELLRTQRQRTDYLLMKQARVVAMTCTHAAIARSHLIELGFEYDNLIVEEAGQMTEIESFIPLLLQQQGLGEQQGRRVGGATRLKRVCLLGDHHQLPPVIKNMTLAKYSNLDQSLFTRLIRLGVPYILLDKQGRTRPEIADLYSWRYANLGNLSHVLESPRFQAANPGLAHTFQVIDVGNFEGRGETSPTAYFYQNEGEAEYVVALFQYLVLIGYHPSKISILTTYNGQKELIHDIVNQRCGVGTPLAGVTPLAISTVDQYQGQQNDIILLSLVRTEHVGHLRDIRRVVVAVSRARLGLYVFCRQRLFGTASHDLQLVMDKLAQRPNKLELVLGEHYPCCERTIHDEIKPDQLFKVDDVSHMGTLVHQMQVDLVNQLSEDQT